MIFIFFMVFKQCNTFLTPSVQVKGDILIDVSFSYIIKI
ncbi:hypothetical protein SAMN05880553_5339 [Bacillus toyonensis]|nr:hypothetical protein SAMN05880553_5339 [Bacillus toyonensis]